MKKIILIFVILLLSIALVLANGGHKMEIEEGKRLVQSQISCDKLTDDQLEAIGEYYMEQMHPGESHELMHKMMGIEEGTQYHKQFHVNIAQTIYCGSRTTGYGMMGSGMMGGNMMMMPMMRMMMGGNMINNVGYGMMGTNPFGYGYGYWSFWNVIWLLFWIGLIVLIIWVIYKFIIKRDAISGTPLEILRKRYASGEVTKKQFEQIKKEIEE